MATTTNPHLLHNEACTAILLASGFLPEVVSLYMQDMPTYRKGVHTNISVVSNFIRVLIMRKVNLLSAIQPRLAELVRDSVKSNPDRKPIELFEDVISKVIPADAKIITHPAIQAMPLDSWQQLRLKAVHPEQLEQPEQPLWFYHSSTATISQHQINWLIDHLAVQSANQRRFCYCPTSYESAFDLISHNIYRPWPLPVDDLVSETKLTVTDSLTSAIDSSMAVRSSGPAICIFDLDLESELDSGLHKPYDLDETDIRLLEQGQNIFPDGPELQQLESKINSHSVAIYSSGGRNFVINDESLTKLIVSRLVGVVYLNPNPTISF